MSSTQPLSEEEALPLHDGDESKYGYIVADGEWHEIAVGETKIGRDALICSIVFQDATISSLHAVIESEGPEDSFIYDASSLNKTKIGKMVLKPECRYKINDNDTILMGSKIVQYRVTDHRVENCKTESSFNILKSDGKNANISTVIDKNNENAFDTVGKLNLNIGEQARKPDALEKSLFVPEKISNKPKKPYYILASELFSTNIFSQATQCEVKTGESECLKTDNKESVDSDNDDAVISLRAHHERSGGGNKTTSKSKSCERRSGNMNKITESYLDDSGTFDFVRGNEIKHFLSSSMCKSISDDIFDVPTQVEPQVNVSPKILSNRGQNFESCFSSKLFDPQKSEDETVSGAKTKLENDSCKTKVGDDDGEFVDSQFFDDEKDEELCEILRSISPGDNHGDDCILKRGKTPAGNNGPKKFSDPDEIFEIQTQIGVGNINNFNQSKSETLDLAYNEKENFKLNPTNKKGKGLRSKGEAAQNSAEGCSSMAEKVKKRKTKSMSKKKLKNEPREMGKKAEASLSDNSVSKFCAEEAKASERGTAKHSGADLSARTRVLSTGDEPDDSHTTQKGQGITRKHVATDGTVCGMLEVDSDSDSRMRFSPGDPYKNGEIIKSPLVNETLNEVWEKQSNCSRLSSNRTLSDLDVSEFQVNRANGFGSDNEGDFIATQGLCLPNSSNIEGSDRKMEAEIKKSKSKLDIWKENWRDFLFTQDVSNEKRKKSESESTDKTESDIVVIAKPIPDIGHCDIHETSSEEQVFDIEENSNESECLIKESIEDGTSSGGDVGDQAGCESPVLLESNIQTDSVRDEEDRGVSKSAGENSNREHEPSKIRVVCDSDETDCEEELQTRKLSISHKFLDLGNNRRGDGVFPSTSVSTTRAENSGETRQSARENTLSEIPEESPLKRTRENTDADGALPKKRSKNAGKQKANDDIGVRQLRSRSAKPSGGRLQSEDSKKTIEAKVPGRKRAANANASLASRKKLEFVAGKSSNENDRPEVSCGESDWQPSSVKILFTGFESESHNRIITKLGGLRVNDFEEGNVLVTDKVRRTVKFLSGVALGLPIVSPKWLLSSNKESKFLNPWDFLLEDEESEERWGFNLKTSLENWKTDKLLKGYNVFATSSTKPPVPEILSIVKCCGGTTFTSYPETWPEKSIVLTCLEDKKSWPHYRHRSVKILHYEFLLSGVLKHEMDFKKYKLR